MSFWAHHQASLFSSLATLLQKGITLMHFLKIVGKNGFEHNKLEIFELKLQWVPQTLFGGSTWECVLLHEEMNIIY